MQTSYVPQRRMTGSSSVTGSRPGTGITGMPSTLQHPQPQYVQSPTMQGNSSHTARPTPYQRPQIQMPGGPDIATLELSSRTPEITTTREPSPPLSQTIQAIVATLSEKDDRKRARAHELEVLRMKREESERVRWHQVSPSSLRHTLWIETDFGAWLLSYVILILSAR